MKPNPKGLAVLISLIGINLSWAGLAVAEETARSAPPEPGSDSRESANELANPLVERSAYQDARGEIGVVSAPADRSVAAREGTRATVQSISSHTVRRPARRGRVNVLPTIKVASNAPSKRAVSRASAAIAVPGNAAAETALSPSKSGLHQVAAVSKGEKTRRVTRAKLALASSEGAGKSIATVRKNPAPKLPRPARAIELATPAQLTAAFDDPLMPLLRTIAALETRQKAGPFTGEFDLSATDGTPAAGSKADGDSLAQEVFEPYMEFAATSVATKPREVQQAKAKAPLPSAADSYYADKKFLAPEALALAFMRDRGGDGTTTESIAAKTLLLSAPLSRKPPSLGADWPWLRELDRRSPLPASILSGGPESHARLTTEQTLSVWFDIFDKKLPAPRNPDARVESPDAGARDTVVAVAAAEPSGPKTAVAESLKAPGDGEAFDIFDATMTGSVQDERNIAIAPTMRQADVIEEAMARTHHRVVALQPILLPGSGELTTAGSRTAGHVNSDWFDIFDSTIGESARAVRATPVRGDTIEQAMGQVRRNVNGAALPVQISVPVRGAAALQAKAAAYSAWFDIFDSKMAESGAAPSVNDADRATASDASLPARRVSREPFDKIASYDIFDAGLYAPLQLAIIVPLQPRNPVRSLIDATWPADALSMRNASLDSEGGIVRAMALQAKVAPPAATEPLPVRERAKSAAPIHSSPANAPVKTPAAATDEWEEMRLAVQREAHRPEYLEGLFASDSVSPEPRLNPLQGDLVALSDSKLDGMRGGFETDNGLKVSFGIERAVYINGNLVTTTSLNVSDLSKLSAGQAVGSLVSGTSLALIQNGPGSTFLPTQVGTSGVGTVIQNTLNDQRIQAVTMINATVDSLAFIKNANIQSSIQSALTGSIRR